MGAHGAQVTGVADPADCCWEHLSRSLPALQRLSVSQQCPGSVSSSLPDFWFQDSSLQFLLSTNSKLAASWLCDQPATITSEPCSPSNELPYKPHHPAHHATFFTPRTKLNWTSWKPPSSTHRLTYLGYYPPQFPLVSCSQTPHLSFPLAVQSSVLDQLFSTPPFTPVILCFCLPCAFHVCDVSATEGECDTDGDRVHHKPANTNI
ncbi:uncharacterized protein LOC124884738 isoform X2 [Girardinichthys multiradiatus]|uniref:uncharacterized protein LOC124884738 isoform X2 n=1 Tax=Girardinichthys multiradiatus TaxID=208333 RepID=UPI001FACA5F3|nr:uncharacterized protein LOC124884738 isoform X2 [Girardinichthys multiradiatus]